MASMVVWKKGNVSARWNSYEPHWEVFVVERIDEKGIAHGRQTSHISKKAAIRAAQRHARKTSN